MKHRKIQYALVDAEAGIQSISKTGFHVWLINVYSFKARMLLMSGDVSGARDALGYAEKILFENMGSPFLVGEFMVCKFLLALFELERALGGNNKTASSAMLSCTSQAGNETVKTAGKNAFIKTEALKLMGVYYWVIGRQRKAMKWWRKAIAEGKRLNDRLELSRTYFEVGKRLLEPTNKYKELDGIKAWDYLEKAQAMFEEMDLQWDLDELEKLKIQMES
jgi:tetratricopeptide (TPR) repeat protein